METEERIAIQEPDYRLESLKAAATLKNVDLAQLLTNADRIEQWLNEPEKERQKKLFENYKRFKQEGFTYNLLKYPDFDGENKTAQ